MKKICSLFFIFYALMAYGQVTLEVGTEEKEFKVNQKFKLIFILEVAGENMIQETRLRMPDFSKFEVVGNASEQNTILLEKGSVNQQIVQWILEPKQTGRVKIGSAMVTVNGKIYKTEPFDIFVKEEERKMVAEATPSKSKEVYLNLEVEKKAVYKNQPTVAVLKAYSKNFDDLRKVKKIQLPTQENITVRPISYKKSDIDPAGPMASQVVGVFLIFPKETGKVEVKSLSAHVLSDGKKINSNKVNLTVKKLPPNAPVNYKDAVGDFRLKISHSTPGKVEVKQPITVSVKLSGTGNFTNLKFPELLPSPDYKTFAPQITSTLAAEKNGLTGEVTARYIVVPQKAGPIHISAENFSFFDPKTAKYVDLGSKNLLLKAFSHQEILAAQTPLEKVNEYTNTVLETVNNPMIKTEQLKVVQKDAVNWKALLINTTVLGMMAGALLLATTRRKRRKIAEMRYEKEKESRREMENYLASKTDPRNYIPALQNLIADGDFQGFFIFIDDVDKAVKKRMGKENDKDFQLYLETTKGARVAEAYRDFKHKIEMEKYAPVHTKEHMEEVLQMMINLYSEISK